MDGSGCIHVITSLILPSFHLISARRGPRLASSPRRGPRPPFHISKAAAALLVLSATAEQPRSGAAAFHLYKADLEWFARKLSLFFPSRSAFTLKVSVYAGRNGTTCGVSSGRLLGKATISLDLKGAEAKPVMLHSGWISVGRRGGGGQGRVGLPLRSSASLSARSLTRGLCSSLTTSWSAGGGPSRCTTSSRAPPSRSPPWLGASGAGTSAAGRGLGYRFDLLVPGVACTAPSPSRNPPSLRPRAGNSRSTPEQGEHPRGLMLVARRMVVSKSPVPVVTFDASSMVCGRQRVLEAPGVGEGHAQRPEESPGSGRVVVSSALPLRAFLNSPHLHHGPKANGRSQSGLSEVVNS